MTILTSFMPNKHILFSNSLLAIAGLVRMKLKDSPKTIDELWLELKNSNTQDTLIKMDFTQLILALNLLFAINQLSLDEFSKLIIKNSFNGVLCNETD
ncbi:ABC-three component system middle component 6 [Acinetobacter pittii]|uniref:ABC-three component system middle component 6 n=1 Tax=Acinetobacter pittii TaxID=48296 RepID=UPI0027034E5B|nr:ABC-three component system middle component 6 [Acinetobacter pittii]MDO7536630.1 hypothetical protein [Acinetobacter pittii]